jgi:hypothetical protein
MTIQVENIGKQENEGQTYFTFSLTLVFPDLGYVKNNGWRYFPSTGTVAAPQRNKGKGIWVPVQWLGGHLYDQVTEDVQKHFVSLGLCEEPWESPDVRKAVFEGRQG